MKAINTYYTSWLSDFFFIFTRECYFFYVPYVFLVKADHHTLKNYLWTYQYYDDENDLLWSVKSLPIIRGSK